MFYYIPLTLNFFEKKKKFHLFYGPSHDWKNVEKLEEGMGREAERKASGFATEACPSVESTILCSHSWGACGLG
jgi:hypothetical protein